MTSSAFDASHADALMAEALGLAERGRGSVEPNPRVGAVMLQDGVVVGRGWHAEWGGEHAEPRALADARQRGAQPDTLVVTLEPCSARGGQKKQPPCVDILLEANIRRVIVGMTDPDPRHRGRGLDQLRAAGVDVVTGVREEECRAVLRPFERWLGLARPWTIAKWAMTLDGKIAAASGESKWISNVESRRRVHALRTHVDAIVVGFRTAQRDNPRLTVRDVDGPQPVRVVVDPSGELPVDSELVATAREVPTWVLVGAEARSARCDALVAKGVEVVHVDGDQRAAWRALRERGLRRVLVEGGGALLARLWSADCIDQVRAFVAPKLVGGVAAPTPFDGVGFASVEAGTRLTEWWWAESGGDLEIHGLV